MKFRTAIWYSIIALTLISCSARWHIKRAIKKDQTILHADTVVVKDTVILPEIKHDTALILNDVVDTFYIQKERLKVKITRIYDTLEVSAECQADTVVRVVEVPQKKVVYKETLWEVAKPYAIWFIVILVVINLYRYVMKMILP